ncbi:MAG: DNA polymerase [Armatimonadetes bacterium JP3_11]|nr:MAG: DNA polymerase [Armatimonadetes bacterium JP3_11]RMH09579.1 MAG: DNA polymerase [Armatimonadota bacterium]
MHYRLDRHTVYDFCTPAAFPARYNSAMPEQPQLFLEEECVANTNQRSFSPLEYDPVLFGKDPTPYIVAIETVNNHIRLFIRERGALCIQEEPFRPWLLSDTPITMPDVEWQELKGELEGRRMLKYLAYCANREVFDHLRRALRDEHHEILAFGSLPRQYLMLSGKTLFKGMTFEDLNRVQVDIETSTLMPDQGGARVLMVALSDTRGYEELLEGDEKAILEQLNERIQQLDPDVIEGHNLFGFDLPYLSARAKALGVPLRWGRDGSELRFGSPRQCIIGANSRTFTPAYAHGRHLIDTYLTVQRFDIGRGDLESYGLKEATQQLGIAAPDRIYLEREQIPDLWRADPETVRRYCLQDVHETRRLADLTLPTEFYQCQMLPDTLQNLAVIGTGEKVNLMFIRAYLAAGYAVPTQQAAREYPGGYTEVRKIGLIPRIVKADVESLYPSIMLRYRIKPQADHLDVFLPTLERLRTLRLNAKARAKKTHGAESAYWDGLQSSFKILINSYYGYLGAPFNFNDYDAAEAVTLKGQELVKQIASEIERLGGVVVEIDTDGVYFQPPEYVQTEEEERAFVEQVGAILPEGIRLAYDGRYKAMLSVKTKNYVLQGYDDKLIFKGAALRSRADEKFGRDFLNRAIEALLNGEPEKVAEDYQRLAKQILTGEIDISQLCRRERITEKSKQPNHPLYELAKRFQIGDYVMVYRKQDGSLGLLEEYAGDEDREHYVEKLYKFAARLQDLFPDFESLFPRPQTIVQAEKQPSLFD